MIRFADENTEPAVRQMWKICFEDTDEFMNLYFSKKYKNENTLVYFEEGKPVASLQMLPYTITFYKKQIPFCYLSGLCTLPEYRNRGYMKQLMHEAHKEMKHRNIPLSVLIPAEDWLYGYYERFGYEKVFEGDKRTIPLKRILGEFSDIRDVYWFFNSVSRIKDFTVQKSLEDFETVIEEYYIDGCPPKHNLSGMACIIDVPFLLDLYATSRLKHDNDKYKALIIKVNDNTGSSQAYKIQFGFCKPCGSEEPVDIETDERLLCRLLFGFNTDKLPVPFSTYFPKHHPVMNLMLE
ncbi:MAG: GNAT family N-acetyltransferase [Dysgonomonas sp.]